MAGLLSILIRSEVHENRVALMRPAANHWLIIGSTSSATTVTAQVAVRGFLRDDIRTEQHASANDANINRLPKGRIDEYRPDGVFGPLLDTLQYTRA